MLDVTSFHSIFGPIKSPFHLALPDPDCPKSPDTHYVVMQYNIDHMHAQTGKNKVKDTLLALT